MGSAVSVFSPSFSDSTNINEQVGITSIAQSYSGTCDIECDNSMEGVNVDIINSNVGGNVELTQSCTVNGQCLMASNVEALADVTFKAKNSSSAQGGCGSFVDVLSPCANISTNISRSKIVENFNQAVQQTCKVRSVNSMNNISVLAASSNIGGGIYINQHGNATGSCSLQNVMGATAKATSIVDNCSVAGGKKATKACSGKNGKSSSQILLYTAIAIVVIVVLCAGGFFVTKYAQKGTGTGTAVGVATSAGGGLFSKLAAATKAA